MLITVLNVSVCSKMVNFLFSAYFDGHFCYHSKVKSQTNIRLIHLGHCSNKLVEEIGEKQISFFGLIGGQNSLLMHVAIYWFCFIVRGDRDSRANLMPIYGDLYQIKL